MPRQSAKALVWKTASIERILKPPAIGAKDSRLPGWRPWICPETYVLKALRKDRVAETRRCNIKPAGHLFAAARTDI